MNIEQFCKIAKLRPKEFYSKIGSSPTFKIDNMIYHPKCLANYDCVEYNSRYGRFVFNFNCSHGIIWVNAKFNCDNWKIIDDEIKLDQIEFCEKKFLYFKMLIRIYDCKRTYDRCSEYCMPNIMMRKKGYTEIYYEFLFEYDKKDLKMVELFDIKQKESELQEEDNEDVAKESNDLAENDIALNEEEDVSLKCKVSDVKKEKIENLFDFKTLASDLGVEFGLNLDSRVKSTLLGTVFEYESGRYRGFDRDNAIVTDYASIKTVALPTVVFPVTSVKKGDMILRNGEFFFITAAENINAVKGANILTLKEEVLLPVQNPIGIKCYTRLVSLGEILGFNGETTQDMKIMLWVVTLIIQKLFDEGVDKANQKILEFSDKTGKYLEILFPFACVGFAAYAIKGKELKVENIAENVKKTFGIDLPELSNEKNLKKLMAVGMITGATFLLLKNKMDEVVDSEKLDQEELKSTIDDVYECAKKYESVIKKVLPLALAICALKIFNGEGFERIQDTLEGVVLIVKDFISEKFGFDKEDFTEKNDENLNMGDGTEETEE